MKEMKTLAGIIILAIAAFATGAGCAYCQMLPPPPVLSGMSSESFSQQDRLKLSAIYRMTRAMHTRLFPLSEEQRILNGGTVDLNQ